MPALLSSHLVDAAADISRCEATLLRRCDERNVHALRVATRRARALLWSLHAWTDKGINDRCARDLKRIAAGLAPMRDLDVVARFLTRVARKATPTTRQRRQLADHLARERTRERRAQRAWLQSAQARGRIRRVCLALRRQSLLHDVAANTMGLWQRHILRSVAKVDQRAQRVKRKNLHSLRILAKRSQYALEVLGAIAPRDDLQRMAELHASLGRYCDARLATAWLKSHRELLGDELTEPLLRAAREIARRRARRVRKSLH